MKDRIQLTIDDTRCLKAISIVLIVLHNLLHIKSGFHENEFSFSVGNVAQIFSVDSWGQFYSMFFSYFGWYGVPCFVFLSGYGLTAKYLNADGIVCGFSLIGHLKKLLLLVTPIIAYWVILYFFYQRPCGFWQIISTATFTANFFYTERLSIEWYFGLCAQLYVLWFLCYVKRWIQIEAVFVICLALLFCSISLFPEWQIPLRHNFIGWIVPFFLGCNFDRLKFPVAIINHRTSAAFVMFILFVISSLSKYLWLVSDVFFILMLVLFSPYLRYKPLMFIGIMSANMYVVQQIVRRYFLLFHFDYANHVVLISIFYLVINIGAAYIFYWLFNKSKKLTSKCNRL